MSLSNLQTKLGCLDYPLYWLIQKIHPIVELSVFWIQLSNLNYDTICPIMDILLTKTNRASHNQRHESIKRLKEQSAHYYEMFPKIIIFKQRKTLAERMQNTSKTTRIPDPTATRFGDNISSTCEEGLGRRYSSVI